MPAQLSTRDLTIEKWRRGALRGQLRPTQNELSEWWDGLDAILTIVHGRRGLGKSWWLLTEAFSFMAKNPGSRQIYAAPTREECKKIVLPTARLIVPDYLPADVKPVWMASDHYYLHPNGATLVIEGADDDNGDALRGPFADRVYGDEVGFWRMPEYVWRSVLYPQVERRAGRAIFVSTSPVSPQHEFATVLIPEAKTEGSYAKITLEDDYTVSDAAKDKIAAQYSRTRDPVEGRKSTMYRREYGCELVTETERAVLPEFDADQHVREYARPDYFDRYVVADIGMTDLTHALFAFYDFDRATIVIEDEVVRQYATVSQLAPELHDAERRLWGKIAPKKRASDAQPIVLAEFARQHLLQPDLVPKEMRFSAVNNRDPEALINRARSLLASKRIEIHPRCVELIKQARGGLWNEKRTDFERIKGLGHLDGVMALVYLVDSIDYATNPRLEQQKLLRDDHPTEWLRKPETERYRNLQKILPRAARRVK